MEAQKVYIRQDNTVVLQCPGCNVARTIPVSKLVANKHLMSIKCSCKTVFKVQLEYRKKFRKETKLQGYYTNLSVQEEKPTARKLDPAMIAHYGGGQNQDRPLNCIVQNISKGGLGMTILGPNAIEIGHVLDVQFTLNNAVQTVIERKVYVRFLKGDYVGCEFSDGDEQNTALGFYLL